MVRVTVLASGSKGNSTLVCSSRTRLLIDCGLSCRETLRRLGGAGEDAVDAVLITHEHSDHVAGLEVLARRLKVPVYMTGATHQAWARATRDAQGNRASLGRFELFEAGRAFQVGDIAVTPFTIPHDAADPVAFALRLEGVKVAVCTDLGYMANNVRDQLRGCDVLMVESNHDLEMLRGGPYPWAVKQRVMSRVGHLSNDALAEFFSTDYDGHAAYVVLAHLSEQNNHPEIARRAAETALERRQSLLQNRILLASQSEPLPPMTL